MKWLRTLIIFDRGDVVKSTDWNHIHESFVRSIKSVDFPEGSGSLTLRRKAKISGGQWDRNGVVYLKRRFLDHMVESEEWQAEVNFDLGINRTPPKLKVYPSMDIYSEPITSNFGSFDLVMSAPNGTNVAIEWETGNISSSHRSMNKLVIALETGRIKAGVLIVPSRNLYEHLTDRIGNISELSGYLSMWKNLKTHVKKGLLAIAIVEHDNLTNDSSFPYLPTGRDGRAKQGKAKRH